VRGPVVRGPVVRGDGRLDHGRPGGVQPRDGRLVTAASKGIERSSA